MHFEHNKNYNQHKLRFFNHYEKIQNQIIFLNFFQCAVSNSLKYFLKNPFKMPKLKKGKGTE